jgi:hypothetical protein
MAADSRAGACPGIDAGAQTIHRYANGDWLDGALIGEDWVLGKWLSAEPQWCLRAYETAC